MILDLGDAKFDIDLTQTMYHYAAEGRERCDCAYCRNFSATVDKAYPNLRPFLAQFGIDINVPDESMPFDRNNEMWYENVYSVCGHVLEGEEASFLVDGVEIWAYTDNRLHVNPVCPEPRFLLGIGMMVLPWVLEEPMEEVLSPANEPSFLQRMWYKLLGRIKNTDPTS